MKKICDLGLGFTKILNHGNDLSLELVSVYHQGEVMGNIICKDIKLLHIFNNDIDEDEGLEGCYISSICIKKLDNILIKYPFKYNMNFKIKKKSGYEICLESGSINGKIICLEAILNIKDKYKNILIEV